MSKTQLFDLDGKIAFVSGASRGIGEAIAKLLAQQGAHVIVSSRKIDGCQAVADAIIAEGGKAMSPGFCVPAGLGGGVAVPKSSSMFTLVPESLCPGMGDC